MAEVPDDWRQRNEDLNDCSSCRYAVFDRWRVTKWAASGGAALALVVTVVLYVSAIANTRAIVKDLRRMQYDRITGLRTALMRRGLSAEESEKLDERIREQNLDARRGILSWPECFRAS